MPANWTEERREQNRQHLARARANAAEKRRVKKESAANTMTATVRTAPGASSTPGAPRPGTRAYVDTQPPGFKLPDHWTDESIAARNASNPFYLGPAVKITKDEMDKKLNSEYNPFEEAADPWVKANPDKRFAWQSPHIQKIQGKRAMTQVLDANGKPIEVAGQTLYWESKDQFAFKQNLKLKRASEQAATPEESYDMIAQEAKYRRNNIGKLKDGDILEGVGHRIGTDALMEGAAQIGVVTGNDPRIVGL